MSEDEDEEEDASSGEARGVRRNRRIKEDGKRQGEVAINFSSQD